MRSTTGRCRVDVRRCRVDVESMYGRCEVDVKSIIICQGERLVTPPSPIFYKRDEFLSEV